MRSRSACWRSWGIWPASPPPGAPPGGPPASGPTAPAPGAGPPLVRSNMAIKSSGATGCRSNRPQHRSVLPYPFCSRAHRACHQCTSTMHVHEVNQMKLIARRPTQRLLSSRMLTLNACHTAGDTALDGAQLGMLLPQVLSTSGSQAPIRGRTLSCDGCLPQAGGLGAGGSLSAPAPRAPPPAAWVAAC